MRGDWLPLWQSAAPLDPESRGAWELAAYRIALGVELAAHLEPLLDTERLYVGFCSRSPSLARALQAAIQHENVDAALARAHPDQAQAEACDVVLPCRPGATSEEINHVVLAAIKAGHALLCGEPLPRDTSG